MGLRAYTLKRTAYMLLLIFFVLTLNFFIFVMMPGDPTAMFVKAVKGQEKLMQLKLERWGLNAPLHIRYMKYLTNMISWQFGESFITKIPVAQTMVWRIQYTFILIGGSTIISLIIGVILGVIAAHRRGGAFDSVSVVTSLLTYSLPVFWMGMLFILVFYSRLDWFPNAGAFPRTWGGNWPDPLAVLNILGTNIVIPGLEEIKGRLLHLFLPMLTLVLFQYGGWLLLTRATMLETITEDYVVTARAKGLSERAVLFKHALKNASLPLITSAAMSFGFMFSGAIITETVFTYPGVGRWIWEAILNRDYPVLQATFYVIALCVIVANFIADLLYGVIDPRVKYG